MKLNYKSVILEELKNDIKTKDIKYSEILGTIKSNFILFSNDEFFLMMN